MIVETTELMGIDHVGIGSDLCQNWEYSKLEWMRSGRWTSTADFGEGSASNKDWPTQPTWFADSGHFGNIAAGLQDVGMSDEDVAKIMGENWLRFFRDAFVPETTDFS